MKSAIHRIALGLLAGLLIGTPPVLSLIHI